MISWLRIQSGTNIKPLICWINFFSQTFASVIAKATACRLMFLWSCLKISVCLLRVLCVGFVSVFKRRHDWKNLLQAYTRDLRYISSVLWLYIFYHEKKIRDFNRTYLLLWRKVQQCKKRSKKVFSYSNIFNSQIPEPWVKSILTVWKGVAVKQLKKTGFRKDLDWK